MSSHHLRLSLQLSVSIIFRSEAPRLIYPPTLHPRTSLFFLAVVADRGRASLLFRRSRFDGRERAGVEVKGVIFITQVSGVACERR